MNELILNKPERVQAINKTNNAINQNSAKWRKASSFFSKYLLVPAMVITIAVTGVFSCKSKKEVQVPQRDSAPAVSETEQGAAAALVAGVKEGKGFLPRVFVNGENLIMEPPISARKMLELLNPERASGPSLDDMLEDLHRAVTSELMLEKSLENMLEDLDKAVKYGSLNDVLLILDNIKKLERARFQGQKGAEYDFSKQSQKGGTGPGLTISH